MEAWKHANGSYRVRNKLCYGCTRVPASYLMAVLSFDDVQSHTDAPDDPGIRISLLCVRFDYGTVISQRRSAGSCLALQEYERAKKVQSREYSPLPLGTHPTRPMQ